MRTSERYRTKPPRPVGWLCCHECMMRGYQTSRTVAPTVVRLARTSAVANAAFLALILSAKFAIDRLAGILIIVMENLTKRPQQAQQQGFCVCRP